MPVKPSPPPITGLCDRRHTEPVLIMRGSDATPRSNCLALAWPYSEPTNEDRGDVLKSGGGDRLMSVAEQRKNHTSVVISPSGQPMLKVQSTYQGFFTPEKFYPHSPGRTPPTGGFTMTSTPQQRRIRGEEKTGSFFSFDNTPSPARPPRALASPPYRHASPRISPLTSLSREIVFPSSEKRVRFRGDGGDAGTEDSTAAERSLDSSLGLSCHGDMSTSSVNSVEGSEGWHSSGRMQSWSYRTDHDTLRIKSSLLGGLCQRFCWWLATILVVIILCFNLSFIYFDYQASNVKVIPMENVPLKAYLEQYLVHQPIAVEEISSTLDSFLLPDDNRSSVVLSFHGGVGVGKSFTSDLIRQYYFGQGDASLCLSIFSVPIYDSYETETVREKLEEWLRIREVTCRPQLFILEDLHGYTPCRIVSLVRESLESFLERKADSKQVVIIITDIAALSIMQDALYNMETNMKGNLNTQPEFRSTIQRSWEAIDEFKINDVDVKNDASSDLLVNQKMKCDFIGLSKLINVLVPFLPLERQDVKGCVLSIASRRGWTVSGEQEEWVADQLTYEPSHWPVFSSSGCKLVAEKLGLIHNVGKI